jgi:nicotinamide phosphoribosyltransferase
LPLNVRQQSEMASEWVDVYKDPVTDAGKRSKRGVLALVRDKIILNGFFQTLTTNSNEESLIKDELVTVFENGMLVKEYTFDEVRETALKYL